MSYSQRFLIDLFNRKTFLCVIFLILFSVPSFVQAKIIYVKPFGIGSGISWNKAAGNLAAVIRNAPFGTEVWVAAGTYTPTKNKDRNASFVIPDGVKVYGGFLGNELFKKERDPVSNLTILSGEIGTEGLEDNSFSVVYTKNVSDQTLLDGFHIINGCAKSWEAEQGAPVRSGAGWYNDGRFGISSPQIINCFFSNNWAIDGGAIYNNGMAGKCEVIIKECSFIDNVALADGGAIYNSCHERGVVFTYLSKCNFERNESNNGAGIFNYNVTGVDEVKLLNCSFVKNVAFARGSAVFDHSFDAIQVAIENCFFEENEAALCRKDVYSSLFKEPALQRRKKFRSYRL